MLRKICIVVLGLVTIAFAISLRDYETVESLNGFYDGKGLVKRLLTIMYSTIGQIGTIIFLIAFACFVILSQFGIFDKKV